MDATQILGSLLGNNATSSGLGGQILGQLVSSLAGGAQGGRTGGGLADILGGLSGGAQGGRTGGGLADILSSLTGGSAPSGGTGGGLADILGGLAGRSAKGGAGGGLADILSSLTGSGRAQGGIQGGSSSGLLGGLVMAALQMFAQGNGRAGQSSFSGLADTLAPRSQGISTVTDATQAHQQALALVKAMINAAKADGQIDAEEQQKIVSKLVDLGPQEATFVQDELNKPLNFDFFADITQDMALQVYAASLMAINLDTPAESHYMQQLAQGLGLDPQIVNGIHAQLGLAPLYG